MNDIGNKIVKALDGLFNAVLCVAAALMLFISGYSLLDNLRLHQQARDDSLLIYKPELAQPGDGTVDLVTLDGQVAWLCIEGTYIDFPVMQGRNNFEYLNKTPYGEFALSGSIFLDSSNTANLTDDFSMIYGHHMDHYSMFGSLDLFTVEAYFDTHKTGWVATEDGFYDLELFAVAWGNGDDWTIFSPKGRTVDDVLPYIQEHAVIYTEYIPGTRILAMSTCAGSTELSRLIVFGMLTPRTVAAE